MNAPVPLPLTSAEDRALRIPAGHIVRTGYVAVDRVVMANRTRMAVGDVDRAYQKRLQLGDAQSWPPPYGTWQGEQFCLLDGRHEYVATLMLGHRYLFVAWVEKGEDR